MLFGKKILKREGLLPLTLFSNNSSYEEINVIFFNNGVTASIITPQSNKEDM